MIESCQNRQVRHEFGGDDQKVYNLKEFKKTTIKMVYDSLHGISTVRDSRTTLLLADPGDRPKNPYRLYAI